MRALFDFLATLLSYWDSRWLFFVVPFILTFFTYSFYKKLRNLLEEEQLPVLAHFLRSIYKPFFCLNWLFFFYTGFRLYLPVTVLSWTLTLPQLDYAYQFALLLLALWSLFLLFNHFIAFFVQRMFHQEYIRRRFYNFLFVGFYVLLACFFILGTQRITAIKLSPLLDKSIRSLILWSITVLVLYLTNFLLNAYSKRLHQREQFLAYALLKSTHLPLLLLIGGWALITTLNQLEVYKQLQLSQPLSYWIITVPPCFWLIMRIIQFVEEQFLVGNFAQTQLDKNFVQTSSRIARTVVIVISSSIFFLKVYEGLTPVLGIFGGGAVLFGFIGKDTFSNYLSGVIVYFEGRFKVGDLVSLVDLDLRGTIEYIGFRTTSIRTLDKQMLTVPNSYFSNKSIINISQMTKRRILERFGIEIKSHHVLDQVTQQIRVMLQNHPGIDQNDVCMVHFIGFGPASLQVEMSAFTKTKDWKTYRNVQQDILLKVIQIVEANGARIAYPAYRIQEIPPLHFHVGAKGDPTLSPGAPPTI